MKHILEFGSMLAEPKIRTFFDMKEVVFDTRISMSNDIELYYMYRELSLNESDALTMSEYGVRYDITVIPPLMLGCEFVKTAGHYHPIVPGTDLTFPEIYEVLSGEAYYIMQKPENNKIKDVILVKASKGDKVIIPPGYGHLTINTSNKVLKMANWVARDFESMYDPIKEKKGGAYFILENGIVKNPSYDDVQDIRLLNPTNIHELGLEKTKQMYGLVNDIDKLEFLTRPEEYSWLFESIYP